MIYSTEAKVNLKWTDGEMSCISWAAGRGDVSARPRSLAILSVAYRPGVQVSRRGVQVIYGTSF